MVKVDNIEDILADEDIEERLIKKNEMNWESKLEQIASRLIEDDECVMNGEDVTLESEPLLF